MANQFKNDHNDHKSASENLNAKNGLNKNAGSQNKQEHGKQNGSHQEHGKQASSMTGSKENKSDRKEESSNGKW